jgi:hypothetical protein
LSQKIELASYRVRHDYRLNLENKVTGANVGKDSFLGFLNRTVRDWNALPEKTFNVESRKSFRRKLNKIL